MSNPTDSDRPKGLHDHELRSEPARTERRSWLKVAGAAVGGSMAALLGGRASVAAQGMPPRTGCNDSDTVYPQMPDGISHDYAGRGQRCNPQQGGGDGPSGCTDRDPTDSENFGRNCRGGNQPPPQQPPPQQPPSARPPTGPSSACTDRDPAPPRGDPGGRGRNCRAPQQTPPSNPQPTNCSDSDSGAGADPGGRGRNCRGSRPPTPTSPPIPRAGCSDSDSGSGADRAGRGRHCR